MVEVMKIMATSFKRSHAGTATLSAPNPAAATADPRLRQGLLDSSGQVWVSLLGVTATNSWALMHARYCLCPPRVYFPDPN